MPRRTFSAPRCLLLPLVLLLGAGAAFAQFNGSIQGTVSDTSGAVIGGATVTVQNQETGQSQRVTTSTSGFYQVSGLAPGKYTVTVSFEAFQTQVQKNVEVRAEAVQGLDVTLQPGQVTQQITVTAAPPPLQTETGEVSGNLGNQQITALPQVGRDPYELLRLAPGVFGDGSRGGNGNANLLGNLPGSPGGSNTSIFQTENQVQISANGQRVSDNNFMIDGVSVNSLGYGGAAVVTPSQESVKEIKVTTNAYDSQYGRNSGAQVEVVSQNGTNQFHGSGFFKYDEPGLNAFNKYGGPSGAADQRVQNAFRNFGGSLGGPIKKDKLFFFFAYEGLRNHANGTSTPTYVETSQYRDALVAARPGSTTAQIFQTAGVEPRIIQTLTPSCTGFAAGNCQVVNGGLDLGSFTGATGQYVDFINDSVGGGLDGVPDVRNVLLAVPATTSGNQYNARMDFNHSDKDTFSVSTYFTKLNSLGADAGADSRPMADVAFKPLNSAATLTWNRILSPTLLNQARLNFTRFADNQVVDSASTNFGIPEIQVESYPFARPTWGASRSETTPALFAQNTIGFSDTLHWVVGSHATKFGIEITKEQDNSNLLGGARPLYSFSGLWNLANGTPIFEAINTDPRTGAPGDAQKYFRTSDWGLFGQDDWKVRSDLTLNFGLRWEYFSPLSEHRDQLSNIAFPAPGDLKNAVVKVTNPLFNSDYGNFAPRFGFAYAPREFSSKLVVRGGVGLFYDRIPDNGLSNVRGNPPFFARNNLCCGTSSNLFGSPFANGQITYVLGSSKSPLSYPTNPALAFGIDPTTGGVCGDAACDFDTSVEIYGAQPNLESPYVYEWSFGAEYALPQNWILGLNYEGSAGHKFARIVNQNFLYANNPSFFAVYFPLDDVNTSFNGMTLRASHRFAGGFQTEIRYRWSKSIDELSYGDSACACGNQTYPQNLKSERGPSDFDATHYVTWSGVWDLPFLRGRNDWLGKTAGGWQVSGIMTWHTGFPWTPVSGTSVETPGGPTLAPTRPVQYFGNALVDTSNAAFTRPGGDFPGGGALYFNYQQSGPPGIGRNSFRGPHYFGTDLSVAKSFGLPNTRVLGEAARIEVRANAFNVFNQLNLQPFLFDSNATHVDRPTFGQADAGLSGRVVEFQARLSF